MLNSKRPPIPRTTARSVSFPGRSAWNGVLAPSRVRALSAAGTRGASAVHRAGLPRSAHTATATQTGVGSERPLAPLSRRHVQSDGRLRRSGAQTRELPRTRVSGAARVLHRTATYRSALRSWGSSIATSRAEHCTGSCVCASLHRTTATSSANSNRRRTRSKLSAARSDLFYERFGFSKCVGRTRHSTRRKRGDASWAHAESALRNVLARLGVAYSEQPGGGAFYGPKLEFVLQDRHGRDWSCGTIQFDLVMPPRFDLRYVDVGGERRHPVMLHRALYGSLERFFGMLLEHYGAALPAWLCPASGPA